MGCVGRRWCKCETITSHLQRTRCRRSNCPERPCFKQFGDVYAWWAGGRVPALLLASVQVLKKEGHLEGVSTTKHIGRPSLEVHVAAHQPPRYFHLLHWGETEPQTAHRTYSRACSQQVLESGPSCGAPKSRSPPPSSPPRERTFMK